MSAKIGSLNVDLTLETARFTQGLTAAQKQVAGAQKGMAGLGGSVGAVGKSVMALGAAFAGSAIASELAGLATRGLEYASALGEQAQQLGVTTDALQEYRYAATQAGLEQGEMDAALAKLTRSLGEAAAGSKAQAAVFDTLGIAVRDANGNIKSAGDILPEIAEKLKGIQDPAQRATMLVDLFGKSGQKLEPLLAGGAAGVNNLRDAAHKLGIVLSSEQIQKADDAADKLAAVKQVLEAKIAGIVADNADAIVGFANAVETLISRFKQLMDLLNRLEASPGGKLLKALNSGAGYLTPTGAMLKAAGAASDMTAPRAGSAPAKVGGGSPAPNWGRAKWNPLPGTGKLTGGGLQSGFDRMIASAGGGGAVSGLERLAAIGAKSSANIKDLNSSFVMLGQTLPTFVATSDEEMGKFGREAKDMAIEATTATDSVAAGYARMAQDVLGSLQGLANSIRGGGFLDILTSVLDLVVTLAGTGLFGGGGASKTGGNYKVGSTPKVPKKYALGTHFAPGGLALVGEQGPELLNLPRGSRITPNHALGQMGGGNTYNFSGNLLTPEFWGQIQAMDAQAARAGGAIGVRRMNYTNSRRVG